MVSYLLIGATYAFAAAVQPGPLQSFLISQSLTKGWKKTLPASFAPLLSDGPVIVLVLLLLTRLPVEMLTALRFLGGFFLLYLAVMSWKSSKNYDPDRTEEGRSGKRTLMQATFVNLLNPNAYLGWSLILGPILIKGWHDDPKNAVAMLISFYAILITTTNCILFIFASARRLGKVITKYLIAISTAALACFGVYQVWAGLIVYLH